VDYEMKNYSNLIADFLFSYVLMDLNYYCSYYWVGVISNYIIVVYY